MENFRSIQTVSYQKNFKLMIIGQIISILGSALLRFTLSLYVLDITGRADIYATLYGVSNIPLLLSPLGGAIADRFNRKNLMVIFDLASSLIILVLGLIMTSGNSSILLIGVTMVLLATISAMYTPAVTASIPLLVKEEKLEAANGMVQAVQALSGVVAPILGGVLYGIMKVESLIFISGFAFFFSAVMEMFIRIPFSKRLHDGHIISTIIKDLGVGFTYVVKQKFILKAMVMAALLNLVLTPFFIVGGPLILKVTMNSSDSLYGIGMGLINFSTIVGAAVTGIASKKITIKKLYKLLIIITILFIPLALAVTPSILKLGHYPSIILFISCSMPIAMIMTIISIYVITKVQKKTSNENLGKVMAIIAAVSQCMAPIGQIIYGFSFEKYNNRVYIPTLFICIIMAFLSIGAKKIMREDVT